MTPPYSGAPPVATYVRRVHRNARHASAPSSPLARDGAPRGFTEFTPAFPPSGVAYKGGGGSCLLTNMENCSRAVTLAAEPCDIHKTASGLCSCAMDLLCYPAKLATQVTRITLVMRAWALAAGAYNPGHSENAVLEELRAAVEYALRPMAEVKASCVHHLRRCVSHPEEYCRADLLKLLRIMTRLYLRKRIEEEPWVERRRLLTHLFQYYADGTVNPDLPRATLLPDSEWMVAERVGYVARVRELLRPFPGTFSLLEGEMRDDTWQSLHVYKNIVRWERAESSEEESQARSDSDSSSESSEEEEGVTQDARPSLRTVRRRPSTDAAPALPPKLPKTLPQ